VLGNRVVTRLGSDGASPYRPASPLVNKIVNNIVDNL
jgi:hypothetical protein